MPKILYGVSRFCFNFRLSFFLQERESHFSQGGYLKKLKGKKLLLFLLEVIKVLFLIKAAALSPGGTVMEKVCLEKKKKCPWVFCELTSISRALQPHISFLTRFHLYSPHTHTHTHTQINTPTVSFPVLGEVAGRCDINVWDKSSLTHTHTHTQTHTHTVEDLSLGLS